MHTTEENPLSQLKKAIITQKTSALPEPPVEPALQAAYAAISDYDRHVSERVFATLQGNLQGSFHTEAYPERSNLDRLIDELPGLVQPENQRYIAQYRRYYNRIVEIENLVLKIAAEK